MNCKNCGELVKGNFCPNCGQDVKVRKINFSNFLTQITESVFLINKGFFYTLVNLFSRPGESIREFLDGKRKYHFKPLAYVLVLSTAYYFLSRIAEQSTLFDDLVNGFFNFDAENENTLSPYIEWFSANYAYATLILIPLFSLASFICFLGYKTNYLEHIVLNSYITGQQTIFYSIFISLEIFSSNELLEVIPVFLSIGYAFWVFWGFFKDGSRVLNFIRSLGTYLLYLILCVAILSALGDLLQH